MGDREGGALLARDVKLSELLAQGTEANRRWREQLDEIAAGLQELKAAGVVVLSEDPIFHGLER